MLLKKGIFFGIHPHLKNNYCDFTKIGTIKKKERLNFRLSCKNPQYETNVTKPARHYSILFWTAK